jgi:hypothetical protein
MKVVAVGNNELKGVHFSKLKPGECFLVAGNFRSDRLRPNTVRMKLSSDKYWLFEEDTTYTFYESSFTIVEKVDAEIHYKVN